jgi:hypothetical protein
VLGAATGGGTTALIDVRQCSDLTLANLVLVAVAAGDATSAAIGLSQVAFAVTIRDCMLVAERGIVALEGQEAYLLTAQMRVADNILFCSQQGVRFAQASLHYGALSSPATSCWAAIRPASLPPAAHCRARPSPSPAMCWG